MKSVLSTEGKKKGGQSSWVSTAVDDCPGDINGSRHTRNHLLLTAGQNLILECLTITYYQNQHK
jgi:hypothetical protein